MKWRDSKAFVKALLQRNYIAIERGKIETHMHEGPYLYMFELFRDGRKHERKRAIERERRAMAYAAKKDS